MTMADGNSDANEAAIQAAVVFESTGVAGVIVVLLNADGTTSVGLSIDGADKVRAETFLNAVNGAARDVAAARRRS
jgi:hypothetical protein